MPKARKVLTSITAAVMATTAAVTPAVPPVGRSIAGARRFPPFP